MSFANNVFKGGNIVTALAVGLGVLILAPVVVPILAGAIKPIVKGAAAAGKAMGDLVSEVKAELDQGTKT